MQSVQLLGPWMTADHLHLLKLTKTKKKTVEMMKMVDMWYCDTNNKDIYWIFN